MFGENEPAVTPHFFRQMTRRLRQAAADYQKARTATLAPHRDEYARETAILEALQARFWFYDAKRRVAACLRRGVRVGAAWSPRALEHFRSLRRS
jgi:hypothetical protein